MTDAAAAPSECNILILGGVAHLARALVPFLLRQDGGTSATGPTHTRRITKIRIVDKHLITGTASTTYVDPVFAAALKDERVEYRQANLFTPDVLRRAFQHDADQSAIDPSAKAFDIVFDLTGERAASIAESSQYHVYARGTLLSAQIAAQAAQWRVKACVRDSPPFWTTRQEYGSLDEATATKRRQHDQPKDPRAFYYYEAERAVAQQQDLAVVILRSANIYGPHQHLGTIAPRVALGEVYRHLDEPLRFLWSSDLQTDTLHSVDWCRAAWSAALWTMQRTRSQANEQAGIALPFIAPRLDGSTTQTLGDGTDTSLCSRDNVPIAPVFNICDGNGSTQGTILQVIANVFGIKTGFTNTLLNVWARLNLAHVVEESNEKHARALVEMQKAKGADVCDNQSTLALGKSPISVYLCVEDLAQRSVALDAKRTERILGWRADHCFSEETVSELVQSFKDSGAWVV